jgi:nicotinamide-nucleotide amidase
MPIAEIIAIGTELLLGEISDTNTQYIARTLRDLGIHLYRTTIVGDNKDRIATVVREAMGRSDIIITTGGLGPTVDDPTREALAMSADTFLVFKPELWENILKRFFITGRVAGENQKQQAYIPKDAVVLPNPVGTAPAFIIRTTKNAIISLPGVPAEMKTIMAQSVIPYLKNNFNLSETLKVRILHTSGAGEGWIDEQISDLERLNNPTVGLAAHYGIVDIRIAAMAETDKKAEELIDNIEKDIRSRLGDHIFGCDSTTLEAATMEAIIDKGWTICSVETGTTGLLFQRLSSMNRRAYVGASNHPGDQTPLKNIVERLTIDEIANVILGLSIVFEDNTTLIQLIIHTPAGVYEHQTKYSGHPDIGPILGVNLILDRLRRIAKNGSVAK